MIQSNNTLTGSMEQDIKWLDSRIAGLNKIRSSMFIRYCNMKDECDKQ